MTIVSRRGGSGTRSGVTPLTSGAKFRGPMLGLVNEKALRDLGWPQLCAEVGVRARTPMGRELCLALVPGDDPDVARRRLALVEEARVLRRHERELPLADAVDVRPQA